MPKIVRNETEFCSGITSLDKLPDVSVSSPAAGDVLVRNSSNNGWTNNKKFAVVTGTFPSTAGTMGEIDYPSGFTQSNCVIIGFQIQTAYGIRFGCGVYTPNTYERTFVSLNANKIQIMSNLTDLVGSSVQITLMKI